LSKINSELTPQNDHANPCICCTISEIFRISLGEVSQLSKCGSEISVKRSMHCMSLSMGQNLSSILTSIIISETMLK